LYDVEGLDLAGLISLAILVDVFVTCYRSGIEVRCFWWKQNQFLIFGILKIRLDGLGNAGY